jgi:non-ribosomal peptide synthetase-like protein
MQYPYSIGAPFVNIRTYIVDPNHFATLQPPSVPGELVVAGQQVARGYMNLPDLTAQSFVSNPFAAPDSPHARMYRTGDLCRWLPDGTIGFMGRIDFQVKLRGYRIELGEIETTAVEADTVREAVAVVREDTPGIQRIVLYVTPSCAEVESVLQLCKERLTHYMVPSAVVTLESWPRTGSGKIDRKALPPPLREGVMRTLRAVPMLIPLAEAARVKVAEMMETVSLQEGEEFFNVGDTADAIFIVETGEAEALVNDEPVIVFAAGGVFGDGALLADAPRGAMVRALNGTCSCLKLGREHFTLIIEHNIGAIQTHQTTYEVEAAKVTKMAKVLLSKSLRELSRSVSVDMEMSVSHDSEQFESKLDAILATVPLFSPLDEESRAQIAAGIEVVEREEGEHFVTEGDEGDCMFVIEEGAAEAVQESNGVVMRYGAGGWFGELALSTKTQRMATVRASNGRCRCLKLGRLEFDRIADQCAEVLELRLELYKTETVRLSKLAAEAKMDRRRQLLRRAHVDSVDELTVDQREASELELQLFEVYKMVLGADGAALRLDTNFFEAGGNSLAATRAIGLIRQDVTDQVSLRDFFDAPTVRDLATKLQPLVADADPSDERTTGLGASVRSVGFAGKLIKRLADSKERAVELEKEQAEVGRPIHWLLRMFVQAIGVAVIQMAFLISLVPSIWLISEVQETSEHLAVVCVFAPLCLSVSPFAAFICILVLKWLVAGRMTPGRHRVFSWRFLQWWFLKTIVTPVDTLSQPMQPSIIYNIYLRLLGGRIHLTAVLNNAIIIEPDLLNVEARARLGVESNIRCHAFQSGGILALGPVHIGAGASVGPKAVTQPYTKIGDNAMLAPLSAVELGDQMAAQSKWVGSPAESGHFAGDAAVTIHADIASGTVPHLLTCLLGIPVALYLTSVAFVPTLLAFLLSPSASSPLTMLYTFCALIVTALSAIIVVMLAKWTLVGRLKLSERDARRGYRTEQVGALKRLRHWIVDRLMLGALFAYSLRPLSMTPAFPWVLRLLGAKVGKRCLIGSDVRIGSDIDLLELGDGLWFGSEVMFLGRSEVIESNDPAQSAGTMHFHAMRVGDRVLLAERVTVMNGACIGDDTICGSITLLDTTFEDASIVVGSPPVSLGRNKTAHTDEDDDDDDEKASQLKVWMEVCLFLIPLAPYVILLVIVYLVLNLFDLVFAEEPDVLTLAFNASVNATTTGQSDEDKDFDPLMILIAPVAYIAAFGVLLIIHVTLISLQNFAGGQHDLYSGHMLLWLLTSSVQAQLMELFGLFIKGTQLMTLYLRIGGATMGDNVFWDTLPPVESKGLTVEDDAIIEEDAMVLGHVVDHGKMTHGKIHIGKGAVVGAFTNIQPLVTLGDGVTLGCLTLAMKGEAFPAHTSWAGCPARRSRALTWSEVALRIDESESSELSDGTPSMETGSVAAAVHATSLAPDVQAGSSSSSSSSSSSDAYEVDEEQRSLLEEVEPSTNNSKILDMLTELLQMGVLTQDEFEHKARMAPHVKSDSVPFAESIREAPEPEVEPALPTLPMQDRAQSPPISDGEFEEELLLPKSSSPKTRPPLLQVTGN